MVNNSKLTGPLCKYEDEIFAVMERKGYKFDLAGGTTYPEPTAAYMFSKEKQISDNRFWKFIMTIQVDADDECFSAEYELQLQEYSKNEKGYPVAYWGRTPWATAKSCYWIGYMPDDAKLPALWWHV